MLLKDIRPAVGLILEADNFYKHVYKLKLNYFLKLCVNQEENEFEDELKAQMGDWVKVQGYVPKESSVLQ